MLKLTLINGDYSPLDGNLNLERLLQKHYDDVVLSCDEPFYKVGNGLERESANYLTTLLPHDYQAVWDESEEGYRKQKSSAREMPPRINELRFGVVLQKRQ